MTRLDRTSLGMWVLGGIAVAIGSYFLVPLMRDVVWLGRDEGIELMKARLVCSGFELYSDIWSEQPPLYTDLLAVVLWFTEGRSILACRLLTVFFTVLLFVSLSDLAQPHAGGTGVAFGLLGLMTSAYFPQLGMATMQAVPSMALSMASAALVRRYMLTSRRAHLVASGVLFGSALLLKFTAGLLLPVCLMFLFTRDRDSRRERGTAPTILVDLVWWCAPSLILGVVLWARVDRISDLLEPHFSARTRHVFPEAEEFSSLAGLLFGDLPMVALAGAAVFLRRDEFRRALMAPLTLLAVSLLAHSLIRPFFNYYYLHLAIPIAWLCALGLEPLMVVATEPMREVQPGFGRRLRRAAAFALIICSTGLMSFRLTRAHHVVTDRMRIADAIVLRQIERNCQEDVWLFTDEPIFAFHAGLLVPPEIAVLSEKRRRLGLISSEQLAACLVEYRCNLVVIRALETDSGALGSVLADRYEFLMRDGPLKLYRLRPQVEPMSGGGPRG